MRRALTVAVLLVLMGGFGTGVYTGLGHFRKAGAPASATTSTPPDQTKPVTMLAGSMYLVQHGDLYRLRDGRFTRVTPPGLSGLAQPSVTPDGRQLLAVVRHSAYSDVVLFGTEGSAVRQLIGNQAPARSRDVADNHWSFGPRTASNGMLFMSADRPKNGYQVDLAVWSQPLSSAGAPVQWTRPNAYTGGDVDPVPLDAGGIIYTKYGIGGDGKVFSQVWSQATPLAAGRALTKPEDDCGAPSLAPGQTRIAMICTQGQQHATLMTATFAAGTAGPLTAAAPNPLCASPAWAPDGSGIAFLAPARAGGPFQLWWLHGAGANGEVPIQVTDALDLDATSAPAWTIPDLGK